MHDIHSYFLQLLCIKLNENNGEREREREGEGEGERENCPYLPPSIRQTAHMEEIYGNI